MSSKGKPSNKPSESSNTDIAIEAGSTMSSRAAVQEDFVAFSIPNKFIVSFIRAHSYEDTQTTGKVEITGLSNTEELRDKNVLIVDDIVDTSLTISRIVNTIQGLGARQVWTSVLHSKRLPRTADVQEDFVAFNIPNKFIVGFGLDYNQIFREGHICAKSENCHAYANT